jgi:hypothetical protein
MFWGFILLEFIFFKKILGAVEKLYFEGTEFYPIFSEKGTYCHDNGQNSKGQL